MSPGFLVHATFLDNFFDPRMQEFLPFSSFTATFFRSMRAQKLPTSPGPAGWTNMAARSLWTPHLLNQIGDIDYSANLAGPLRHGFHYPVIVQLEGRDIPAYFIAHHMGHAASVSPISLD